MGETGARVLVIDDEPLNRMLLKMSLEQDGHTVTEADNGRRGLELLAAGPVDLVLMDIEMPEMDGYAVLERRHEDAALRDIPWLVISAVDEMESIVRCIKLGAEDYLPKPFDPVLLKARVGACLEKKRLRDAEKSLLQTVTRQAEDLAAWNSELERRVAESVAQVEGLNRLRRFLAPQLADVIISGGDDLLESHRREITVLFCDLRGFTPFSEGAEPEDVMSVLAELHGALCPLIFAYQGTLAQFTGDGMMVFFNDPIPCDEPALLAVRLAMEMRERAADLAHGWRQRGHALGLGVGIAIGYATCGRIGFGERYEYTAIGTVTNVAARLCAAAAGGQVLVTERVFRLVEPSVEAELLGPAELKGIARPVETYNITRLRETAAR